jgi:hypothetical protein
MGRYALAQTQEAVEAFTLAYFTRTFDWSKERTQVLTAGVRNDFRDPKNYPYCNIHFVYGQKPKAT